MKVIHVKQIQFSISTTQSTFRFEIPTFQLILCIRVFGGRAKVGVHWSTRTKYIDVFVDRNLSLLPFIFSRSNAMPMMATKIQCEKSNCAESIHQQ